MRRWPTRYPGRAGKRVAARASSVAAAEVGLREVLCEFRQVGRYLRINAIDPVSGVEVTMMGDPKAGTEELKTLAVRKLAYVLKKKRREAAARNGGLDELA